MFLSTLLALNTFWCAGAAQVRQHPADCKSALREWARADPEPQTINKRAGSGYVQAVHFADWGANFQPTNIAPSDLAHNLHALAGEPPQILGDSRGEAGNNLLKRLKQMHLLKLANRNLKLLLSARGCTHLQAGYFNLAADPPPRSAFAPTATPGIENFRLGVDIECASAPALAAGLTSLLVELRTGFGALAKKSTLPLSGAPASKNHTSATLYSRDLSNGDCASYNAPSIAKAKAQCATVNGLARSLLWDLGAGKAGSDAPAHTTSRARSSLDQVQNRIECATSRRDHRRIPEG
ncbi:uncharacterized protein C8Q71DRAFT_860416 [Rhodofomes roseus]|uniref:Uncharacterized protein n=1 Tax=Rhodofomes roseus TaxID=34475 RepID=A0ABQ8K7K7_9APHY|nr:uncharacterized protein C8Q71DRAFT_860416 [Rhodofomes roseus]KAH9833124.1 hypothetical protein C8Q71DRAFT_860416 [Rhodofomes roseus]